LKERRKFFEGTSRQDKVGSTKGSHLIIKKMDINSIDNNNNHGQQHTPTSIEVEIPQVW
jgi:hypothetical protein